MSDKSNRKDRLRKRKNHDTPCGGKFKGRKCRSRSGKNAHRECTVCGLYQNDRDNDL